MKSKLPLKSEVEVLDGLNVLSLSSDVVDANLLVNRVIYFTSTTPDGIGVFTQSKPSDITLVQRLDTYLYSYSNFNESIINSLKKGTTSSKPITVKNLNRYKDQDDLVFNFNNHPIGIGYKLTNNTDALSVIGLFNEKTAYYNLQASFKVNDVIKESTYKESFLDFGFTPTYNISTFLNKINPQIFFNDKEFKILPQHFNLTGNNSGGVTDNNIWIDSNEQSNVFRFGKNYYSQWRSLLINTFVDIVAKSDGGVSGYTYEQFLINEKYYDSTTDAFNNNLIGRNNQKFNNLIASIELKILSPGIEYLLNKDSRTKIILWLHDGFYLSGSKKETTYNAKCIIDLVDSELLKLGIASKLNIE
jgi:hypothetical protein